MNEKEFLNQIKGNLNTAVVGDIMDQLGFSKSIFKSKDQTTQGRHDCDWKSDASSRNRYA